MKTSSLKYLLLLVLLSLGSVASASDNGNEGDDLVCQNQVVIDDGESKSSEWPRGSLVEIRNSFGVLAKMDEGSQRNVAMFRLNAKVGDICYPYDCKIIFVSGGNKDLVVSLEEEIGWTCQSIAHYCPAQPPKPKDFSLRENIVDFFDFKEYLTRSQKKNMIETFRKTIQAPDYFKEIFLTEFAREKLCDAYSDSLCYRLFDEDSNAKAKKLGLFDKTHKDRPLRHIDDLFGDSFQLNFSDSEQTIRMFLAKESSKGNPYKIKVSNDTSLDKLLTLESDCGTYKKLYDSKKKANDEEILEIDAQLIELEKKLIPALNNWTVSYLSFDFDIASYYRMCRNCEATFQYDFRENHQVSRSGLMMFTNGLGRELKNTSWCFKGWLFGGGITGLEIELPLIKLNVSYLSEYN